MYGHNNHSQSLIGYTPADLVGHFPLLDVAPPSNYQSPTPPPLVIPAGNELGYSSGGSGCSSYGGSPSSLTTSYYSDNIHHPRRPSLTQLQRSVSSHSFHKNATTNGFRGHRQLVSMTSPAEFTESSDTSPVRRVFSAGDLQRINMVQHYRRSESSLSNENNSIIEGMSKACRYSPEEKKEKIEKYKSKRTQRNFSKKIKYECRKTLADSRPRIRGRFARNDEIIVEKSSQNQWNHHMEMGLEEDDDNWINLLDSFSANQIP